MDSAEHQHGASAARPPKAAPLPEGTASAQTPTLKTTPAAPQTPEVVSATSSTSVSPSTNSPTTIPASIVPITTNNASSSTTKKRPLTSIAAPTKGVLTSLGLVDATNEQLEDTTTLVVVPPALKTKYDNENATKPTAVKAKKTLKKKKKKKFSSILSGMMKPKKALDIHAERESLRKNLGGGNFSKVDKI